MNRETINLLEVQDAFMSNEGTCACAIKIPPSIEQFMKWVLALLSIGRVWMERSEFFEKQRTKEPRRAFNQIAISMQLRQSHKFRLSRTKYGQSAAIKLRCCLYIYWKCLSLISSRFLVWKRAKRDICDEDNLPIFVIARTKTTERKKSYGLRHLNATNNQTGNVAMIFYSIFF